MNKKNTFIEKAVALKEKTKKDVLKVRNITKHERIAKATNGAEKLKHIARADKLRTRYGM